MSKDAGETEGASTLATAQGTGDFAEDCDFLKLVPYGFASGDAENATAEIRAEAGALSGILFEEEEENDIDLESGIAAYSYAILLEYDDNEDNGFAYSKSGKRFLDIGNSYGKATMQYCESRKARLFKG